MTRTEHMQWCKERALQYVKHGDYSGAVSSMLSDLTKHPDTASSAKGICAQLGIMELMGNPTEQSITRYITGFN